jgi:gliding motility-associated-like protein
MVLCAFGAHAQHPPLATDQDAYAAWKAALPVRSNPPANGMMADTPYGGTPKGGDVATCACWIEPDTAYQLAMQPNDDQSTEEIPLPFSFYLYGTNYTSVWINNNGNVSFDGPYGTFSAQGFPDPDFVMVAPFWADVDTRGTDCQGNDGGKVWYRITPTALYVNWVDVGYYGCYIDKRNTFQLIITDGQDPVIPGGANVSFCYKDMQWTTGDASEGFNGFGGFPANVGANRGNGVDYLQFGRFDQPGDVYDGPFGANDGVSWLDDRYIIFATDSTTGNIPPQISGQSVCSAIEVCAGQTILLEIEFQSPEPDQQTVATSTASTLSNYSIISNTSGATASISTQMVLSNLDVGTHIVHFEATDDGTPALTAALDIALTVYPDPGSPPVILGNPVDCLGQGVVLTAGGGTFTNYAWSNGYTGSSILAGPGSYVVTGLAGGCSLASDTFIVSPAEPLEPMIAGTLFSCGSEPATLSTTLPYDLYLWSNGSQDPTIAVSSGAYSVRVTDAFGCEGESPEVVVVVSPNPTAAAQVAPPDPTVVGTTVEFTDNSLGEGEDIVEWYWDFGDGNWSTTADTSHTYTEPGFYQVFLVVTNGDGCTDTLSFEYLVQPEDIYLPNVITPNNDGQNDTYVVEGAQFYPGTHIRIFSRWGTMVFESANYSNNWKPTADVVDGSYFVLLTRADGKQYRSTLEVLR